MKAVAAFLRRPPSQQAMAAEAAVWLGLAWALVRHVPMRYWRRHLNAGVAAGSPADAGPLPRRVAGIVRAVARRLPVEAACLPRAMAAQWMLRRRGVASRLLFGVRGGPDDRRREYHAWLVGDGGAIIGGREAGRYAAFPALPPGTPGRRRRRGVHAAA